MGKKTYHTRCGTIHYWASVSNPDTITLVLLPGLTADHRLFDKQIQYFENRYNVIVWDAPAHASSWPFRFDFDLFDKAKWLDDILNQEGLTKPVIVGQSMGGYVGQAYAQLYPDKMTGFVSIDSAPLREMMLTYDGNQKRYAQIAGHGYRILAAAMEKNLPYEIKCPALLMCGTQDYAGSCIRYNKAWHRNTKIPLTWIEGAGHNSNTDKPEQVNRLIEEFVADIL